MTASRVIKLEDRVAASALHRSTEDAAVPDNELLAAIADGDHGAFRTLMRKYLSSMTALAYRVVFDPEQAREIAQESFLRVWRHAVKWDPDGTATFETWLRRVVVNLSISHRRRRKEQVGLDVIEEMPSSQPDGFGIAAQNEQRHIVKQAMEKLAERQRAAIALYYFDELSHLEAADIMQMTSGAFDSLLVRARGNLKKHLAELGYKNKEGAL